MSFGNDGRDDDGRNEPVFTRAAAEHLIAQSFYPHVFGAANTVLSLHRNNALPATLTDVERYTLNKYTYFGWTVAVVSGFGVFATLFGGLRYGAYLVRRRPSFLLSQPTHHTEMAQKRARFAHLDNPYPTAATTRSKPPSSLAGGTVEQQQQPARGGGGSTWSDVTIHVQFLLCSAVSLLAALAMGNKFSGSETVFPDKLAELPLQPGTSVLCERYLCPAVLQHHRNLLEQPVTYAYLYDTILEDKRTRFQQQPINTATTAATTAATTTATTDDPPSGNAVFSFQVEHLKMWQAFDQDASIPTPNSVYENAQTETAETALMETLQRLVYHCQCRQEFAHDCRRQRRNSNNNDISNNGPPPAIDPLTDLVIVPESGVPLRYLEANKVE